MFSEILKIIPKLETKDLNAMEKSLQKRFTRVAKSFGKGLAGLLKGGGIAGIALGLIDKLLNPLKEVQEAIDKTLTSSDDIVTNAKQFNSTAGKLGKLIALAKSTGLDQGSLFTLINKFQNAVAQAQADPNDSAVSSVRNYVDQKDTIEGFFGFIQSLQKLTKNQQLVVQSQVFGEKQILKMADFLQTDFGSQGLKLGLGKVSTNQLTKDYNKLGGYSDLNDELTSARELRDVRSKAAVIRESMIRSRDQSERLALQRENARIASYENLAAISQTVEKMMIFIEKGVAMLGELIAWLKPWADRIINAMEKFTKSPLVKGMGNLFGGKGD